MSYERRPFLCRIGLHKYRTGTSACVRCGHGWITGLHADGGRMFTGGTSGEHEARTQLMLHLGPGWNLEFVCERDGDTLTLTAPDGGRFAVEIDGNRLAHRWEQP